ncbi:hypothetical protein K469DRAFT_550735 [Zopfia rhizophila CBS 207.26]|uniref:NmrA-like domain-containing protein n=1 Tax=Zopfia rhizophila CBS 207.26 TaxID=1314779 RepID=A0A6A6EQ67_9PEZI|nr:hypothetical protein K469DRAFT_550735 [Zopfia rhizophila CBS 207.26]
MVTVAIAGGTGSVGQTIKDALKENPKYNVIVLARKVPEAKDASVPVFAVDYNDTEVVTKILEKNNVHTVISTIQLITPDSGMSERNLVKSAAKSSPTKRFVASDWGVPTPSER